MESKEHELHFGLLGNGITVYDVSRTDPETHDYPIVAHISEEGTPKIYDDTLTQKDLDLINSHASDKRNEFMKEWDSLNIYKKFEILLDRADISTSINIGKDRNDFSLEGVIEKYTPYVILKEGERPSPIEKTEGMSLLEYMKQCPAGEELAIHDTDYEMESYFYPESEADKDNWDRAIEKFASLLTVKEFETERDNYFYQKGITVNVSEVIQTFIDQAPDEIFNEYFHKRNLDLVMHDLPNILSGNVSENWLVNFVNDLESVISAEQSKDDYDHDC